MDVTRKYFTEWGNSGPESQKPFLYIYHNFKVLELFHLEWL